MVVPVVLLHLVILLFSILLNLTFCGLRWVVGTKVHSLQRFHSGPHQGTKIGGSTFDIVVQDLHPRFVFILDCHFALLRYAHQLFDEIHLCTPFLLLCPLLMFDYSILVEDFIADLIEQTCKP